MTGKTALEIATEVTNDDWADDDWQSILAEGFMMQREALKEAKMAFLGIREIQSMEIAYEEAASWLSQYSSLVEEK